MKNKHKFLKRIFLTLMVLSLGLWANESYAQLSYVTTVPPYAGGNSSSMSAFNIKANVKIKIKEVYISFTSTASQTAIIWYKTDSINTLAANGVSTANGWIQAASITFTPATSGAGNIALIPAPGLSIEIPAGATYGFAVSASGITYTGSGSASVSPWCIGDANMYINMGTAVGYGGTIASPIQYRQFNGKIGYEVVSTGPNNAGISSLIAPVNFCAGTEQIKVKVANKGSNRLDSVRVNWKLDGIAQPTIFWNSMIDTVNGLFPSDTVLTLGSTTFISGTPKTLKVWTSMPNGIADTSNMDDTLNRILRPALSGTYTIGGTSPDFATFGIAVSALASAGVCGPVVFNIASGTYTEVVTIPAINGASSTNTVTFQSATGDSTSVILTSAATTLTLSSTDYFTFKKMTIKSTSATASTYTVNMTGGANYNTFTNCVLEMPVATATTYVVYDATGLDNYNTISYNVIKGGYYGMYIYGSSTTALQKGWIVKNNKILNFYYYGAYTYYLDSIQFTGNYIRNSSTSGIAYGARFYYVDGSNVSNNDVYLTGTSTLYGFYMYYMDSTTMVRTLVSNNFISTGATTGAAYGIYFYYGAGADILYNSVNITAGTTGGSALYYYNSSATYTGGNIANNNLSNTAGGYAIYVYSDTYLNYADFNNYYTTGTNVAYWVAARTDLNALQTTYPSRNVSSKSVVPGYISVSNLHINNAILDGTGTNLYSTIVSTDFDGQLRDASTPDIGADEFTPINNDAGIFSFVEPLAPCPGTASPVKISLMNFGIFTLTSCNINWTVNGVAQTPVSWTGSLSNGISEQVTLGSYTFLAGTSYNLKLWTSSPNSVSDQNTANDTLWKNGLVTAFPSGTYTIGPDTIDTWSSFANAVSTLVQKGVCGPVVINVKPGTYTETVTIPSISGTSAINTITFQSLTADSTSVTLTSSGNTLTLNGADYLVFKKLNIKSTSSTSSTYTVTLTTGAFYNTFTNCILEMPVGTATTYVVYDATGNDDYNTISNNIIKGGYYGMYIYGSSTTSLQKGWIVKNNQILDFYYYGAYTYYLDSIQFIGNKIRNSAASGSAYGARFYYVDGSNISKNDVYLTGTSTLYGFYMYYMDSTTMVRTRVSNNFVSTGATTGAAYGIYMYYCAGADIIYNSVNVSAGTTSSVAFQYYNSSATYTGGNIANNNLSNTAGGYAIYVYSDAYLTYADFNNYYTTGTNVAYWVAAQTNLTALQTAYSTHNINSVSVNPMYSSVSDLHLNNPNLNGIGTPVTIIADDIDGETRNATTPDIGADEFDLINYDAGILSLDAPIAACPGTSAPVTVTFRNFGLTTITECVINWSVNGVAQTPYTYTGSLANGSTAQASIGTYTMAAGITYNFKVWPTMINTTYSDQKASNDTIWSARKTAIPSGTYTIGNDTLSTYTSFTSAVNALKAQGVCGPVVFNVKPGTYTEQIALTEITGTSATNTITFKSLNNDSTSVILQNHVTTSTNTYTVQLNGADYFTFSKMTVKTTSYSTSYGHVFDIYNSAHHNTISNCVLVGVVNGAGTSANVINSGSVAGYDTSNVISNNKIINGYSGIYWYGSSTTYENGNIISGNDISAFYYYGMHTYYQNNLIISGNFVHDGSNTTQYGISTNYSMYDYRITKNRIVLTGSATNYGIRDYYNNYYGTIPTPAVVGLVANNFVSITNGTSNYGLYTYYSNGSKIYYNSVNVIGGTTSSYALYQYNIANNTLGQNFINNIFAATTGYSAYFSTVASVLTSDYNCFHSTTSNFAFWGSLRANLSALQTASSKDANSISVNPNFRSSTDLHKTFASPNDLGTPLTEVTDDIDGDTRKLTTPDMGADEWDQPANDLAVIQIISPYSDLCGKTVDSVNVIIQNAGYASQTNVPVILTGTGPNGAISMNVIIPSIGGNSSATYFIGSINTTTPGTYNLKVYHQLSTDVFKSDDTLTKTFAISLIKTVPNMENFSATPNAWEGTSSVLIGTDHGLASNALYVNMNSTSIYQTANMANKVGPIPANGILTFDYRIINKTGGAATVITKDSVNIWASTDCGTNWSRLYTVDTNSHIPAITMRAIAVPLTAFSGNNVLLAIEYIWKSGDYWVDVDNFNVSTPTTVNLGSNAGICAGTTKALDAGTDPVYTVTYDWYAVGNPVSLGTTQILTVDSAATYYVKKTTQYGLTASDSIVITVNPMPVVSFTGLGAGYCADASAVALTGTPSGGSFTGTGISGASFNPATAGTGTYVINYSYTTSFGCEANVNDTVEVYALPVFTVTPDQTICNGDSLMIGVTGTFNGYLWNTSDTTASITVVPATTTTYNVIVTNLNMCSATDSVKVTVNPIPVINLGTDKNVCSNDQITIDAGAGYTYLWSTTDTTQTITLDTTGYGLGSFPFYVDITNGFGCSNSDTINLTFLAAPVADLGVDISMCINWDTVLSPGTFTKYLWSTGDTTATIHLNHNNIAVGTYTYWCAVEDANGCMDVDSITVVVNPCTGIEENADGMNVKVYPNPSNGLFNIEIKGITGNVTMQLFDAAGRLITNEELNVNGTFVKEFDMNLPKGIYNMKLMNNKLVKVERIVVQ